MEAGNEAQQVTSEPQGWRPEEGETLTGEVVNVSRGWSDWTNSHYPLVTIKEDGTGREVDVHAFHYTLQSRLMETKPKVGDRLEILFVGRRKTKDGKREVAVYRVSVPGASGQEVWDSLEREAPRAAQAAAQGELPDDDIPF